MKLHISTGLSDVSLRIYCVLYFIINIQISHVLYLYCTVGGKSDNNILKIYNLYPFIEKG